MRPERNPGMPLKKKTGPTFLDGKLDVLGFDSYQRYLASKHWRDTRERFYSDPHTPKECLCGETDGLQLHHTTYFRLGVELLEDLHPLCPRCHMDVHVLARRGLMDLKLQGYCSDLRRARYARERTDSIKRNGGRQEDWPTEAFDPVVWAFNARTRHQNEREEQYPEDRRESARRRRRSLLTGTQVARQYPPTYTKG